MVGHSACSALGLRFPLPLPCPSFGSVSCLPEAPHHQSSGCWRFRCRVLRSPSLQPPAEKQKSPGSVGQLGLSARRLLFIEPGSRSGRCERSLGKGAGIRGAVWLAPGPPGVTKSSSNCVYANTEPMLTALWELERWAKHAQAALQQGSTFPGCLKLQKQNLGWFCPLKILGCSWKAATAQPLPGLLVTPSPGCQLVAVLVH